MSDKSDELDIEQQNVEEQNKQLELNNDQQTQQSIQSTEELFRKLEIVKEIKY